LPNYGDLERLELGESVTKMRNCETREKRNAWKSRSGAVFEYGTKPFGEGKGRIPSSAQRKRERHRKILGACVRGS